MKQVLVLTAALLATAMTGFNCDRNSGDYTILVDREDTLYLLPGNYSGARTGRLKPGTNSGPSSACWRVAAALTSSS